MSQTLIQSQLDDLESGIQDMIQIMSQTKFYITAQQNMMRRFSQQAAELEVKCLHLEVETDTGTTTERRRMQEPGIGLWELAEEEPSPAQ